MRRFLLTLIMVWSVLASAKPTKLDLVPGKSLGEAAIGETKAALLAKGFNVDPHRQSADYTYLVKTPLLVLLKNDRAVQICISDIKKHLTALRYNGKALPKASTLESLSKVLGDCGETQTGSGGLIKSCAGGRVELTTSFPSGELSSLCVKSPD